MGMRFSRGLIVLAGIAGLSACADDEVILDGERLAVRAPLLAEASLPDGDAAPALDTAFAVPAAEVNASWTHSAGNASHAPGHPKLSAAPGLIWSTNIGSGNSRKHRITGDPVVAGGRIFAMDSQHTVTAVSTAGAVIWSRDLTPAEERAKDASGGGVAVAGDRVFATTGFGELVALDAASGAEIWRQNMEAPVTAPPTTFGGLVYAVSRDNRAWAVDAKDGRVKWTLQGTPSPSGVIGGASPAVTERVAIFPFASGELVSALRQGGVRLWGSQVSGKRQGSTYANITDITADPVVVGDVVYTGNHSGRAVALSLSSGERLWTARDGARGPVSVAGNSVFLISDQNELIRLDAETGQKVWGTELAFFKRPRARRAKSIFVHFGPVLAGNRLWVASNDGTLTGFDPTTGAETASVSLPGGAASSMAVAGGTLYVISGRGQLHAFR